MSGRLRWITESAIPRVDRWVEGVTRCRNRPAIPRPSQIRTCRAGLMACQRIRLCPRPYSLVGRGLRPHRGTRGSEAGGRVEEAGENGQLTAEYNSVLPERSSSTCITERRTPPTAHGVPRRAPRRVALHQRPGGSPRAGPRRAVTRGMLGAFGRRAQHRYGGHIPWTSEWDSASTRPSTG